MLLVTDDRDQVRAVDWQDCAARMHRLLARHYGSVRLESRGGASAARHAMDAYFGGTPGLIDTLAVETGGTFFQRQVWAALRAIRVGETTTYGRIAAALGRPAAMRAVGAANAVNPVSLIVPCHRVVGANHSLTGYGGGIERKRWLLRHEAASVARRLGDA